MVVTSVPLAVVLLPMVTICPVSEPLEAELPPVVSLNVPVTEPETKVPPTVRLPLPLAEVVSVSVPLERSRAGDVALAAQEDHVGGVGAGGRQCICSGGPVAGHRPGRGDGRVALRRRGENERPPRARDAAELADRSPD